MKYLIVALSVMMVSCGNFFPPPEKIPTPKPVKPWEPGSRCKTIGTITGKYTSVMVNKDCLRNGITTIAILVHNTNKPKEATEEATKNMIRILGFRPTLSFLIMNKSEGKPLYLFLVTGVSR